MEAAKPTEPMAFNPLENHMTVLFPRAADADAAIATLVGEGVDPQAVRHAPPLPGPPPANPDNSGDPEGVMEEVAAVVNESFSDDEKLFRRVDEYRRDGQTAVSFPFDGDDAARQDLARRLKDAGASVAFYWGSWITEQL